MASAAPAQGATAVVGIERSPFRLSGARVPGDSVRLSLANLTATSVAGTAMFGLIGAERGLSFAQRGGATRRIPFRLAPWMRRIEADLALPRDQWPAFTDFGLSIADSKGRILETAPMNYAFGRATLEIPEGFVERDLTIVLTPGLADPGATTLWDANLSIRGYAQTPVLVDIPAGAEFSVAARQTVNLTVPFPRFPWPLEDGFFPLGNLVADAHGALWSREIRLHPAPPPVMR